MPPIDIAGLLSPYITGLTPTQLDQVSTYLDLLQRWNAHMNLTSVRNPEHIVTRHFGESFFLARQPFIKDAAVTDGVSPGAIDVGSGAGFPGIPLKILHPQLTCMLVEAHQKKAVFLREVLRALHLEADVRSERAEDLARKGTKAGLVTMRAVEKFDSILPIAADLASSNGTLAVLVGSAQTQVAQQLLPNWRFRPFLPLPGAETRGILWGNLSG